MYIKSMLSVYWMRIFFLILFACVMGDYARAADDLSFRAKMAGIDCNFDMRDGQGTPLPLGGEYYTLDYKQDSPALANTYYCPVDDPHHKPRLAELAAVVPTHRLSETGWILLDAHVEPVHVESDKQISLNRVGIFATCHATTKLDSVTCAYEWPYLLPQEDDPSYILINFKRGEILYGEFRIVNDATKYAPQSYQIKIIGCDAKDETEFPCHG